MTEINFTHPSLSASYTQLTHNVASSYAKRFFPGQSCATALLAAWLLIPTTPVRAAEPTNFPLPALEAEMHTSRVWRIATDAKGLWAVTVSTDKTARLWSVANGKLLGVMRPPRDFNAREGMLFSVAISPNGQYIAIAGATGRSWDKSNYIYIYRHNTQTHALSLEKRFSYDLPQSINHIAFSPDGRWLAAALYGANGIRVFDFGNGQLVGKDEKYGGSSNSVEFSPAVAGKPLELLSASDDGKLRLYPMDSQGGLSQPRIQLMPENKKPYSARFSPDGKSIAVGFSNSNIVKIFDSQSLREAPVKIDAQNISNGALYIISWSMDGKALIAGGTWNTNGQYFARQWYIKQNNRKPIDIPLSNDSVAGLISLPQGGWLFAAQDPTWGVLNPQGVVIKRQLPVSADFRDQSSRFQLSANGQQIQFGLEQWGRGLRIFDVLNQKLYAPSPYEEPAKPEYINIIGNYTFSTNMWLTNWINSAQPYLNGKPIQLHPEEISRSLAVDSNGQGFVLGTEWWLRAYDRTGTLQWPLRSSPAVAWAVSQSQDGQWVVVGYGDGTIRWHRRKDGQEVLALFVHNDGKRWVLWTPEGFYAASEGGEDLFGYHLNQGKDQDGKFVSARQLREFFYRPELVRQRLNPKGEERMRQARAQLGDITRLHAHLEVPSLRLHSAETLTTIDGKYSPEVEVVSPTYDKETTRMERYRLAVRVDNVEISDARWNAPLLVSNQRITLPTLELPEGEHQISIELVDPLGISSRSVKAQVTVPRSRSYIERPQGTLHVLAVGVSRYLDKDLNLKFAAADAEAIAAKVQARSAMLFKQNVVIKVLINEDATAPKIEAKLREMATKAKPNDTFLFYLAGHGVTTKSTGEYYFLPYELESIHEEALRRQAISQNKLRQWLSWLPAHSLLLLDTCHSGRIADLELAAHSAEEKDAISTMTHLSNRSVIAASTAKTLAIEGFQNHGVFTWAVLDALDHAADEDFNGLIDTQEIAKHVSKLVPKISEEKFKYRMTPVYVTQTPFPIALPEKDQLR